MKKMRRILASVLTLMLIASLIVLPVNAEGETFNGATAYPTVFCHGLLGWGEYDDINDIVPYWE